MKPNSVRLTFALGAALCLLALVPGPLRAQDPNADGSAPPIPHTTAPASAPGIAGPVQPNGSGAVRSTAWIPATRFTGKNSVAVPDLIYGTNHFYTSPDSAGPVFYFAPLDLEAGLVVDTVTCAFDDDSATNNLSFSFQKATINFSTGVASWESLASGSSDGSPGVSFTNIAVSPSETIQNQIGSTYVQYVLRAGVAEDTGFAGCMVYWTRQVSPAPATATFDDVPTSHPFFRHIEALFRSGVTAGCSPTSFCPTGNLTRGEMAVFLAKALGLNYPE